MVLLSTFFLDMIKLQKLCCKCLTPEDGSSVVAVLGISSKSPWFNLLYTEYPVYMSVVLCKYGILSTIAQLQKKFLVPMVPKVVKEEVRRPPPPPFRPPPSSAPMRPWAWLAPAVAAPPPPPPPP